MGLSTFEQQEIQKKPYDIFEQPMGGNNIYTPVQRHQIYSQKDRRYDGLGSTDSGKFLFPMVEMLDLDKVILMRDLPALDSNLVQAPIEYIQSLPAKGSRNKIADALNVWLSVPEESMTIIKRVIDMLHGSSLVLDDIQDSSSLRRGMPATHTIFGLSQAVNSATYQITRALNEVLKLGGTGYIEIVLQTGGLFRTLFRLLDAASRSEIKPELGGLVTLLGRHFGIRDDYQNLCSSDYADQKGFCEDLDEGKFSLPMIHALQCLPESQRMILHNLLAQRKVNGGSSIEHKQLILQLMRRSGSLEYTLAALRLLQSEINKEVKSIEQESGIQNSDLKVLLSKLYV
ncbi:Polyprenyl synthetase-related protein [Metarhizium guizhouense ARSEF 977]|uniref:Polyprenyl synthetase-related protein n=1 Tax=Metarhizium guizhouense (strain ARSEF 977) TaxID=1276136 RepID=A0A0B4HWH7_METGA|nr:Polyprenyl synthetase-related protein [Metarhizium guizhouense ARSEF 977]